MTVLQMVCVEIIVPQINYQGKRFRKFNQEKKGKTMKIGA